ncbi:hypothetical protein AN9412.2 [Aspergillus nidulans FGSC A4]|nr:hypothetical protein AN9412.2 [Aspergillus nidulans FGSC A4]|eukprot:XP_868794.1 hypothetical protein AN9412.2 [Aspergillus nidulans FGSC A4]
MSSAKDSLPPCIRRIRRSDETNSYVLVHTARSKSTKLQLPITATEGESPYTAIGTDDEWKKTLLHILGLLGEGAEDPELLTDVEASASVNATGEDDKELVITIRKRIQTITQKLGSLTLQQDEEQDIELFDWTNLAVTRADILEQRFNSLLDRFRTAESTIKLLNKQLEEFISSKNQHEQQLFSGIVQLLNEKKLKIRNQQRLLASAKVDPERLSKVQAAAFTDNSRPKPKGAKGGRQKRPAATLADESSDDGFEKMSVEDCENVSQGADEETADEGRSTPEPLEDESGTTAAAADDDVVESALSTSRSQRGDSGSQGPLAQATANSPPPRRELPFAKKTEKDPGPGHLSSRAWQDSVESGGETDDDEL